MGNLRVRSDYWATLGTKLVLDAIHHPFVPKPTCANNPIELARNLAVTHNTGSQMSKNAVFVEGKFAQNGQEQEEKGNHVPRLPRDG